MNTAEGDKAANVTLDVDQLEANGNRNDDIPIMNQGNITQRKKIGYRSELLWLRVQRFR